MNKSKKLLKVAEGIKYKDLLELSIFSAIENFQVKQRGDNDYNLIIKLNKSTDENKENAHAFLQIVRINTSNLSIFPLLMNIPLSWSYPKRKWNNLILPFSLGKTTIHGMWGLSL